MYPYWLLFMIWAAGTVQTERQGSRDLQRVFFSAAAVFTALMIGLRFQVGGDWGSYQRIYDDIFFLSFPAALQFTDPGYAAVNWLGARIGLGVSFINLICAILFTSGIARLAWKQPNPALAMLVAVPYLIIVVAMGYTRQAAAIGLICLAVADASERRLIRMVMLILIATLFHKTAIFILPIALVPVFRRNFLLGVGGFVIFVVLAVLVLRDSSDRLLSNYVQSNYDSQGAAVRISMNVLAAMVFLSIRKRIEMTPFQKSYWTTCAILSLLSIAAFVLGSASSGIDRISLYLIPLQLVLYSRLPYLFSVNGKALPSLVIAVVTYSFLIQFIWLNYANNAGYWVPYGFNI